MLQNVFKFFIIFFSQEKDYNYNIAFHFNSLQFIYSELLWKIK